MQRASLLAFLQLEEAHDDQVFALFFWTFYKKCKSSLGGALPSCEVKQPWSIIIPLEQILKCGLTSQWYRLSWWADKQLCRVFQQMLLRGTTSCSGIEQHL